MAFNNNLDFRFKGQVPTAAIVQAFQNQATESARLKQQQQALDQQKKQQQFNNTLQLVQMGGQIAQTMVETSRRRQLQTDRNTFAELLASAEDVFPMKFKQQPPGVAGPAQPTEFGRRGDQPEFKAKLQKAGLKAFPNVFAPQAAKQLFGGTISSGDVDIRPIEFEDGTVQDVIVNKKTRQVFSLSGELISPAVLARSQKGFAPKIDEDLEGRKARITRTGKTASIFGEQPSLQTGKEKRVQFTPAERKVIINARDQFNSSEFVKKQGLVLKEFEKISALVEANPAGAVGPLRTQVAKVIAGEVGRLTDQDIKRNVPTPDLWPALLQARDLVLKGKVSEIGVSRYKKLLKVLQHKMASTLDAELNDITRSVSEFGTVRGNPEVLRKEIGRGTVNFIDKFLPKGKTPEEEAQEFLKGL